MHDIARENVKREPKLVIQVARGIAVALVRVLTLLVVALMAMPVLLLTISTSVPMPIWVLLAFADAAMVIVLFKLRWTARAASLAICGAFVVALLGIVASQAFASTPPILDAEGKPIPGSIATLEKVNLNGSEQWISIRGRDMSKPVLLFLAGGPGGSQLVTERRALGGLEEHFVVVNWEQPGSGKSFDAVDRSKITPERYIADAHALVLYLRQRFGVSKVYVLGESWGSTLGIWLVQRYPELFHAYFGTGQMVAFTETDQMCYEFAMRWAEERGDTQKVAALQSQGPPPYYGSDVAWKQASYLLDTYDYMNQNPAIADDGANTLQDLAGPEYGLIDKVNWFRGVLDTLGVVYPQLWKIDLRTQANRLDVPVYFLIGRHDINAPVGLTEEYYEILSAPHKELIWFEHSGHNPWVNESARFVQVLVQKVEGVR